MAHPNCIVRAGTPEAIMYDDEDLHWHFAVEGTSTLLVQVLRGKRLMGWMLNTMRCVISAIRLMGLLMVRIWRCLPISG